VNLYVQVFSFRNNWCHHTTMMNVCLIMFAYTSVSLRNLMLSKIFSQKDWYLHSPSNLTVSIFPVFRPWMDYPWMSFRMDCANPTQQHNWITRPCCKGFQHCSKPERQSAQNWLSSAHARSLAWATPWLDKKIKEPTCCDQNCFKLFRAIEAMRQPCSNFQVPISHSSCTVPIPKLNLPIRKFQFQFSKFNIPIPKFQFQFQNSTFQFQIFNFDSKSYLPIPNF